LVGSSDNGLPVGERKRYTIGVELVTNPSVLFLGESTHAQVM
jgi:ABC-type multidrug transport system ATPase subunit